MLIILFPSKLYNHRSGGVTSLEGGSIKYFTNCIAILFSMVEPPTPPTAKGARPPAAPLVWEAGKSGNTMVGHMLLTGRLPGPMESGQPGRGSNLAMP